jgi:hypothetical protein
MVAMAERRDNIEETLSARPRGYRGRGFGGGGGGLGDLCGDFGGLLPALLQSTESHLTFLRSGDQVNVPYISPEDNTYSVSVV